MCGIAGFVGRGISDGALTAMARALSHRGPDSEGFHHRDEIGLAVRRLRIIDLVTGDQPITSLCTGATIVYNGELYNYRDLRAELEAAGHRFRTRSDTEVILHFYEQHGVAGLHRLNGIFAFAIDDPRTGEVVLVRDQLGVKPLYFVDRPDLLLFGSEPKAIFASGAVTPRLHAPALSSYLTHGHSVGGETMFEGIRKLQPGHALVVSPRGVRPQRYWDLLARARRWDRSARPARDEVEALVSDAVRRNMVADVPVGAFLSGGIDSSLVTALMRRDTDRLHTYSVGFDVGIDERPDARRVAAALGTDHTEIVMTADDAARVLPEIVAIYDEPFADAAALPTYLMACRAREEVTVVLTGEGGDELFGGYRRYVGEQAYRAYSLFPASLRRLAADTGLERVPRLRRAGRIVRALAEDDRGVRYAVWTETFSRDERRALLDGRSADPYAPYRDVAPDRATVDDDVVAMMAVELRTWLVDAYLEKVDKATMAASLEARVPLLDPRLVEMLALAPRSWKIQGSRTKVLLRDIARRYVPFETVEKPKQGFGPPYGRWLRTTFAGDVAALASSDAAVAHFLDPGAVRAIVAAFEAGQPREAQVWTLLCLELWARRSLGAAAQATVVR